jgi:hypothetical protein
MRLPSLRRLVRALSVLVASSAAVASASCVSAPAVGCTETSCGAAVACVAGRCQASRPELRPAIESPAVVRLLVPATAMAYVRAGRDGGEVPAVYDLGRRGSDAELLLRFARPAGFYRSLGRIVEAYLVLPRAVDATGATPELTSLAAARIVAPWTAATASWSTRPSLDPAPRSTTAVPNVGAPGGTFSPRLVRIDVRALVEGFRAGDAKDARDHSIAVTGDKDSASGLSFATPAAADASSLPGGGLPFLELYLAP